MIDSDPLIRRIKARETAAYRRGWDDAIRSFQQAVAHLKPEQDQSATSRVAFGELSRAVYNEITVSPGRSRKAIIVALEAQRPDINRAAVPG